MSPVLRLALLAPEQKSDIAANLSKKVFRYQKVELKKRSFYIPPNKRNRNHARNDLFFIFNSALFRKKRPFFSFLELEMPPPHFGAVPICVGGYKHHALPCMSLCNYVYILVYLWKATGNICCNSD